VTAFEDSHGREEADAGAEAGAADLEFLSELALWREAVAWFDLSTGDERAYVLNDLHGQLTVSCTIFMDFFFHAE
jgi:hypothetical protein